MLIVPVVNSNDQKKTPYVCFLIIAVNCLIFFLLQAGDSSIQEDAYLYYQESGLIELELNAYRNYLSEKDYSVAEEDLEDNNKHLVQMMFSDEDFQQLLENNRAIRPGDYEFKQWRQKRTRFEEKINQLSTLKYGYSPRDNNVTTLLSCIFLHGGFMHLLGNMVFLYLVGAILEAAIGPAFFSVLYIITGICASGLFGIVYPDTPGPLIGASGAVSGLMGAYGVIFGLRKIRVFYSLGFYFNYAMVPALVLFPVWLANEFLQLYLNEGSNVAYVAHIGGLVSGVTIGLCYKLFLKDRIDALFAKTERMQTVEGLLEQGLEKIVGLNLQGARCDFQKVLAVEPDNMEAVRQIYAIDKSAPGSEQFHKSAAVLLGKLSNGSSDELIEVFEDYKTTSGKPRISIDILERLSLLYLGKNDYGKAAPIISMLFKRNPQSTNLPGYLLKLAVGFRRSNKQKEALKCYQVLVKRYPVSEEGMLAAHELKHLSR